MVPEKRRELCSMSYVVREAGEMSKESALRQVGFLWLVIACCAVFVAAMLGCMVMFGSWTIFIFVVLVFGGMSVAIYVEERNRP